MPGRRQAEELLELVDSDPRRVVATELAGVSDPDARAIWWRARALALAHLEQLDEAVAAIEVALECPVTDPSVVGGVEMTGGALFIWAGRTEAGLGLLQQAAGREGVGSEALVQLGASLYRLGRYREALTALEQAREKLDPEAWSWWSRLETNLGLTLAAVGENEAARDALLRSMEIDLSRGNAQGVATGHHNLGWVASVAGDLPAAFDHYEQAAQKLAAPAELWRDRADALLSAGFGTEAIAAAGAAAEHLTRSGHVTGAAEARLKLALSLLTEARWAEAGSAARIASDQFRSQGRSGWASYADMLGFRARVEADASAGFAGFLEMADELEQQAFVSAAQEARIWAVTAAVGDGRAIEVEPVADGLVHARLRPHLVPAAWLARAEVAEALGNRRGALAAAFRGVASAEELSAALGGSETRAHVARSIDDMSRLAVRLTAGRGTPRRMFDWVERTRSASLRLPRIRPPADEATAALVAELRTIDRAIETLQPGRDLENAARRRAWLESRLRHRSRALRGAGTHRRALRAADVVAALAPDEAILTLASVGDAIRGVLLHRGRARELAVAGRAELLDLQSRSLRSLARLARDPQGSRVAATTSDLTKIPLHLGAAAGTIELLCVVPPPELAALPWSIVVDGPLVAVAPSATSALTGGGAGAESVAAIAGEGLRHAVAETAAVAAAYPDPRPAGDDPVTPPHALAMLDGVDVGHFACHGEFRGDSPLFSSLRLAGGALYLHELERLGSPPGMIVFSACDMGAATAIGRGESLGPVTAMLGAGVETVVASPVLVPDHPTVSNMFARFHAAIRSGIRPARALAEAKASLDPEDPLSLVLGAIQTHGRW